LSHLAPTAFLHQRGNRQVDGVISREGKKKKERRWGGRKDRKSNHGRIEELLHSEAGANAAARQKNPGFTILRDGKTVGKRKSDTRLLFKWECRKKRRTKERKGEKLALGTLITSPAT